MSGAAKPPCGHRCLAPIFIVGTERSGSNLLRLLLNTHSEIAAPHPPHFMSYFGRLEPLYGDLNVNGNFKRLVKDLCAHVRGHIHPWPFEPHPDDISRLVSSRDVFATAYAFYDLYAVAAGKRFWACKSTFMIDHCDQIVAHYQDARLLWLVRDPRDVALSSTSSVFNPYHPFYTARLWSRQQEVGLKLQRELPASSILRVHYEDLVGSPIETVAAICRFVGVTFESGMLKYFETADARQSSGLAQDWQNTGRPVLSTNAGKFATGLSAADVSVVEAAASPVMQVLGYQPLSAPLAGFSPSISQSIRFRLRNEGLRWAAEYRSVTRDNNGFRRWRRAARMALLSARLRLRLY